jgi:hypothetical protein
LEFLRHTLVNRILHFRLIISANKDVVDRHGYGSNAEHEDANIAKYPTDGFDSIHSLSLVALFYFSLRKRIHEFCGAASSSMSMTLLRDVKLQVAW